MVKSQYEQDQHCSGDKEKTAPQLHRRALQDIPYFKTRLHFARLNLKLTIQKQWKIGKLATLSAAVLFFLRDTVDIVDRFYGNEWKIIPFWIHRFFSQRKLLMIRIFDLISAF